MTAGMRSMAFIRNKKAEQKGFFFLVSALQQNKKRNYKREKNKKMVVRQGRLRGLLWAKSATARYPSTVGSGQLSLLCEASLTLCLPHYGS